MISSMKPDCRVDAKVRHASMYTPSAGPLIRSMRNVVVSMIRGCLKLPFKVCSYRSLFLAGCCLPRVEASTASRLAPLPFREHGHLHWHGMRLLDM